jgi:hypothetical protein
MTVDLSKLKAGDTIVLKDESKYAVESIVEIIPKAAEPHKEALRFNEGKPPMAYIPLDTLEGAARVMEKGAKKYGVANYRKGYEDLMSPMSSLLRHTASLQAALELDDIDGTQGYLLDKETGEAHIHHILTCTMIMAHAMKLKGWKV